MRYKEIIELFNYCKGIGVEVEFGYILDGYKLVFKNTDDVIQHYFSYGSFDGCVEFSCFDDDFSYRAISLEDAKQFVLKNKDKLNSTLN